MNGVITGVAIPIGFFFDCVPLFCRSVIVNVCKFITTVKRTLADCGYAVWYRKTCKPRATRECAADINYAVGYGNVCKSGTIYECIANYNL